MMEREVLFNEDFLLIEYDTGNNWVYTNWRGYVTEEQAERGLHKILECLEDKGCSKVLNDNILVEDARKQLNRWQKLDWFGRALQAGLRSIAYIYNHGTYRDFSSGNAFIHSAQNCQINNFKDTESAKAWLRSVA